MKPPSSLPIFHVSSGTLEDGGMVKACDFCRDRLSKRDEQCLRHYQRIVLSMPAFSLCPHGFTSFPMKFRGEQLVLTGVVAAPRFNDSKEMARAKQYPEARVSRDSVLQVVSFFKQVNESLEEVEDEARKRLPQALHELRKLNAIVKDSSEKLSKRDPESPDVKNVSGAAELMSNIFEVVEALANLDGLKHIKCDEHIAAYDLAFKAKKIYQIRAKLKPIHISVNGDDKVGLLGSKKTFPIVLTVLLENAIRYGRRDSTINIEVSRKGLDCVIEVSNRSDTPINSVTCFEKGVRFGGETSEGSGLGLFLAREVVLSHRGSLSCHVDKDLVTMRVAIPAWISAQ